MNTESQRLYNKLAKDYRAYSEARRDYLLAINNIVRKFFFAKSKVIDFGAGDGVRIKTIISDLPIKACLVENSNSMLRHIAKNFSDATVLPMDFSEKNFPVNSENDVAVCLWNVLGHLGSREKVLQGLINIKRSLRTGGIAIIDVNNRHNINQYGFYAVRNILKDVFGYKFSNGDIKFSMHTKNQIIPANVHLFTNKEMITLFKEAGFVVNKRLYIDYSNGNKMLSSLFGQLCYVLTVKE